MSAILLTFYEREQLIHLWHKLPIAAQNLAGRRQADDSCANNSKIIRHRAVSNRGHEFAVWSRF